MAGWEVGEFLDAITEAAKANEQAKNKAAAEIGARVAKSKVTAAAGLKWLRESVEALLVTANEDVASHNVVTSR